MPLYDFILANREQILIEWESFARICAPDSANMDAAALRDHAGEMLRVIAADLQTDQSKDEQAEKSKGRGPDWPDSGDVDEPALTAAEAHGEERAESGFAITQMAAEYRALRASVLRLWTRECGDLKPADLEDLMRFNEAIDQSQAESISEFSENVETDKEIFLAILGHDLRNPLAAIYTTALSMSEASGMGESQRVSALQIAERAMQATQMVGDLLDFTRSRLGGSIPIDRAEVDLGMVAEDAANQIMTVYPETTVKIESGERQIGQWDEARIRQALGNLVANAVEHCAPGHAVTVSLEGDKEQVTIRIHNHGAAIRADRLDGIFNPMNPSASRRKPSSKKGPTGNLGLGLYIAERIVHAHDGRIEVASSEADGTTFTVQLPRGD